MLNRTQQPPIKDAVDFDLTLTACDQFKLGNGTQVYAVNAGAEEVMMIELVFYAGNCFEQNNGVAPATNYLLKNGTTTKTAFQVNDHFEYYGAYLSRSCHNETSSIVLHCLSRHLNVLLPVVREIINEAAFPEEEIGIFKQNSRQRLAVNLQKCDFVANRLIDVSLYGAEHPYGKFSMPEDYDALSGSLLKEFYHKFYQKGKCIIFAAGKLPNDYRDQLDKFFGDRHMDESIDFPVNNTDTATEKKMRVQNDPDGVQGAIRIAQPFPNRHHPDFKKVMILNTLLGGFFGSRLMANIREEKGYTYGIHSYLQNHLQQTAWMISTEAGKDVCEQTIEEVYKEMKILREEPVEEDELLLVKNYMMGTNLGELDGPFKIISRWKNLVLNNLDEKYFYDSMRTIKNISAEELMALSNKYLLPEKFFELVVI
ncbi:MAG: pitrilysin family protein [Ginsengibacter sp.]